MSFSHPIDMPAAPGGHSQPHPMLTRRTLHLRNGIVSRQQPMSKSMRKHSKVDLALIFVIVCIAMTLTIVVAFATPSEPYEMQSAQQFPSTKE